MSRQVQVLEKKRKMSFNITNLISLVPINVLRGGGVPSNSGPGLTVC